MKKIILLKGLPGSGKSTWAKEMLKKYPGQYKRINKDDLRSMFDDGKWSKANEKFIIFMRNRLIYEALMNGYNVIVDDTNLHPKHETTIREIADDYKEHLEEMGQKGPVVVEIKDFTDVPLKDCIANDLKRANSVGKDVIMQMHNQFLKPEPKVVEYDLNLPYCIICDLDGTLALFGDANPYERDFTKDEVNTAIVSILLAWENKDVSIVLVSGRKETARAQTSIWIDKYSIPCDALFMRKAGDNRKDVIVKREIYEAKFKGKYNVLFVLDDRDQVVDMWRQEGLWCLQVAPGDF